MKEIIVGSKTDHELSQMDRLEQRIIDLAYQQTIFLVNDNKQIFALLEKAEAENKAMREALEEIWNGGYFNPDRLSLAELTAYKIIAQDALIATGEPK